MFCVVTVTNITSQEPQPGPTDSEDQMIEDDTALDRMSGCMPSTGTFMSATESKALGRVR